MDVSQQEQVLQKGQCAIRRAGPLPSVLWGHAAADRSGTRRTSPLEDAIGEDGGLSIVETATLSGLETTVSGGRGTMSEQPVVAEVPPDDAETRYVVLVEEEGRYAWFIPAPGGRRVSLSVEAGLGSRGGIKDGIRRVVRFVAVKSAGRVVGHATRALVGDWDAKRHPPRLRRWTPEDQSGPDPQGVDLRAMAEGPALLVIHGITGSIRGSFDQLGSDVVRDLHRAYGQRTFGYDHPTLVPTPRDNAQWFLDQIPPDLRLTVDILAHSRGGLVARELAQRLTDARLDVRSIVFVATPNDGSPLADPEHPEGILDALTNLVGSIPGVGDVAQLCLEVLKDVVWTSGIGALKGLTAMKPGGPYLTELNREAHDPTQLTVRAIAADYEPPNGAGIVRTARDALVDTYFGGVRNDLVVPTLSTYVTTGAFGVPAAQRLVLDASYGIDHSTFWRKARVTRQLRDWLRPNWPDDVVAPVAVEESDPLAEVALPPDPVGLARVVAAVKALPTKTQHAASALVGGPIDPGAVRPRGEGRAVVVLPGIMGTHLRVKSTGRLVWIDALRLARGHFRELELPTHGGAPLAEMEPAGLVRSYLPLISHLAALPADVYIAPFDWRADIAESARQLATMVERDVIAGDPHRTVHFVAHSMGGLVCRAMAVERPDLWDEIGEERRSSGQESSGRLVMLGTPNRGSYSIPLTLLGDETVLKAISAVDLGSTKQDLQRVVGTFPGVYQMLPSEASQADDDDELRARLYDVGPWHGAHVDPALLEAARRFHERLAEVRDPERLTYIAGYGHATPFRLLGLEPELMIGTSTKGDGRVDVRLGRLAGVTTYYSGASHGDLPCNPTVLDAVRDVLVTGRTDALPKTEPVRRGTTAEDRVGIPASKFDRAPSGLGRGRGAVAAGSSGWREVEPVLGEALRTYVGGTAVTGQRPTLRVRVMHASLEQASHPVAVGSYAGLPGGGAEKYLDRKLDGALRRREDQRLYPTQPGSAIFIAGKEGHRPGGGLVLGLGEFGSVTQATLVLATNQAVRHYVLHEYDRGAPMPLGVSTVLVAVPGRHGLSLESSIVALTEGVASAMAALRSSDVELEEFELEIVELYEGRAERACEVVAHHLEGLFEPRLLELVALAPESALARGAGARPGSPPVDETGQAWVRVRAELSEPEENKNIRTVSYTIQARGAQSNIIHHDVDLAQLREFVDLAVRRPDATGIPRALYESLLPHRSKLDLERSENLHLLLDPELAEVPWELLAAVDDRGESAPLALRAGLLRQLQSEDQTIERPGRPTGVQALVIGNPPTHYPGLPNAAEEAFEVATLLEDRAWEVEKRIYGDDETVDDQWWDIKQCLHARPYRIIHIAAHGVLDEVDPRNSGVLIGPADHHRITALDLTNMSVTPNMVFLNCCHLGRLGDFLQKPAGPETTLGRPGKVAASLATALMRKGVGAVVVAGWAVDDAAAMVFAEDLYTALLDGAPFGEAARHARQRAGTADAWRTLTWGAYQCYGDPDFRLVPTGGSVPRTQRAVSPVQLARTIEVTAASVGDEPTPERREEIARSLERLVEANVDMVDDGRVQAALGRAHAELGAYGRAVAAYERGLRGSKGLVTLEVAEQLANVRGRFAVHLARNPESESPTDDQIAVLLRAALEGLEQLVALAGETPERLALKGGLLKRRAVLQPGTRTEDIAGAADAYRRASEMSQVVLGGRYDPYHANLWIQLEAIRNGNGARPRGLYGHLSALVTQLREATSSHDSKPVEFFEATALPDALVTSAVVNRRGTDLAVLAQEAERAYAAAFERRSTARERESSLVHLQDLAELVGDGPRRAWLLALWGTLQ